MAVIDDHGTRLSRGGGRTDRTARGWLSLAVAMTVAAVLLLFSRLDHPVIQTLRWQINGALQPAISAVVWPIGPLLGWADRMATLSHAEAELRRLRAENDELKRNQSRAAELERRVADLSGLVNLVREAAIPHVTARVLAMSSGPQSESVMVSAGRRQGLRIGHPALSADGVAGRVVETGGGVARILLLTDAGSRVPVRVGSGASHAILTGESGRLPRLEHTTEHTGIGHGDEVTTSGVGGMFPGGLRIGTVERDGATLRVRPYAHLDRLEYLSILAYDNPALGLVDEAAPGKVAQRRASAPGIGNGEGR